MREEVETTVARIARASNPRPTVSVRTIDPKNWNAEWEKTITPIKVTDRIVITPTWHPYNASPGQIVLTIDPKMSFGTGYHETTRLVLRLMEHHVRPGTTVLDVGTGTGVLAIAGLKLGAVSAVGVDVDEWSYDNSLENAKLNGVEEQVTFLHGDLTAVPPATFGLIVANIQLNVIVPLLPEMRDRLTPEGTLILSGLLLQDREQILNALDRSTFHLLEEMQENEWIALAVQPDLQ